jgi:hypothetical protein
LLAVGTNESDCATCAGATTWLSTGTPTAASP